MIQEPFVCYVLGFAFTPDKEYVALIKKINPIWQKDKLNGIGGKIEVFETPEEAMVREFKEETDVEIKNWNLATILKGNSFKIYVFRAFDWKTLEVKTTTQEEVKVCKVSKVLKNHYKIIPNLRWLIPLVCYLEQDSISYYSIEEVK